MGVFPYSPNATSLAYVHYTLGFALVPVERGGSVESSSRLEPDRLDYSAPGDSQFSVPNVWECGVSPVFAPSVGSVLVLDRVVEAPSRAIQVVNELGQVMALFNVTTQRPRIQVWFNDEEDLRRVAVIDATSLTKKQEKVREHEFDEIEVGFQTSGIFRGSFLTPVMFGVGDLSLDVSYRGPAWFSGGHLLIDPGYGRECLIETVEGNSPRRGARDTEVARGTIKTINNRFGMFDASGNLGFTFAHYQDEMDVAVRVDDVDAPYHYRVFLSTKNRY